MIIALTMKNAKASSLKTPNMISSLTSIGSLAFTLASLTASTEMMPMLLEKLAPTVLICSPVREIKCYVSTQKKLVK